MDTSFILSCVGNKIDFFEQLEEKGMKILVPSEVIGELKGIAESKRKLKFRDAAKLALKMLDGNRYYRVELKTKNVDEGLKKYAKANPDVYVATLDREIKKILNSNVVIRGKKTLEVI